MLWAVRAVVVVSGGAGTDSSAGAELAVDDQRWKQNKDWKILAIPAPPGP